MKYRETLRIGLKQMELPITDKEMEPKVEKEQFVFWILPSAKCLSFRPLPKYEPVASDTKEEMWRQIHVYIDCGYKVG